MVIYRLIQLVNITYGFQSRENVDIGSAMINDHGAQEITEFVGGITWGPLIQGDHGCSNALRDKDGDNWYARRLCPLLNAGCIRVEFIQIVLPLLTQLIPK